MKKIYLAGPLFSEGERAWARQIKKGLEEALGVEVIWPYEILSEGSKKTPEAIFEGCTKALEEADLLVAMLDGSQVDDGTAWEMGYFYKKHGAKIYGIRTDFRKAGETDTSKINAMIEVSCSALVNNLEELIEILKKILATSF